MASNIMSYIGEFIGVRASVKLSSNPTLVNRSGIIVDETKKTLTINNGNRDLVIPKEICLFEMQYGEKKITIAGKNILFRPEDRIKEHRKIERLIRKGGN
ncbi:MAG: ribonuclease P protein subunit [Thermoplasmataceae archaeon]